MVEKKENPLEKVPIRELLKNVRKVTEENRKRSEEKFAGVYSGEKKRANEEDEYQKRMQELQNKKEEKFRRVPRKV
ncbi:MAG: hypothetical protein NTY73_04670 [Candidatus Micrarchaeota archaeon]|nr:hypothetical protein [Candidatus Micrarchaeota archaeon]